MALTETLGKSGGNRLPPEHASRERQAGRLGVGIGSSGDGAIVYLSSGISTVVYSGGILTAPSVVASGPGTTYYLRVGFDPSEQAQGISIWQRAGVSGEDIWASRLGL
jgi:hypothetical protein